MGVTQLELIARHGTRDKNHSRQGKPSGRIVCRDGFTLSVQAGSGSYCEPRPDWPFGGGAPADYEGPYTAAEVGFPSKRPRPWWTWKQWAETPTNPTGTVYGYVPFEAIAALIARHGGEAK